MKHLLLKNKQWLVVLIALLGFGFGVSAANVNDLKVLGQTATAVAGEDYYTFPTSRGEARWYPTRKILELEDVLLSNDNYTESFVEYTGTDQFNIFLIGTNTFSTMQRGQAKPAIKAGGALSIRSKDFNNRGTLNIYTYGFAQGTGQAAVLLTGYSETRSRFNIERCNIEVTYRGGNQAMDYYFFTAAGGNYKGQLYVDDARLKISSKNLPLLGNATISLSRKDCVRNESVFLDNGKLVKADGTEATYAEIDYPISFSTHDGDRSGSYIVHREDFGTNGACIFDEDEHVLEFHGGTLTGSITYYGREPLVVKTFGTELTTLTGNEGFGIRPKYTSLRFEGDRVQGHQGLKLTHASSSYSEAVRVPLGKELTFDHNAVLTIDGYDCGLVGCDKVYDTVTDYYPYTENCPTLSATNSTIHVNAGVVAVYGFNDYLLEGCRVMQEDWESRGVWIDDSSNNDEIFGQMYYYFQYAMSSTGSGESIALQQVDIERFSNYGIKLAGRDVTLDNIYDLNFKDETGEVSGVTFDEDTYTLTLDNAIIHASGFGVSGIDVSTNNYLTIMVKGECNIESDHYIGFYSHYWDVQVRGEGQFESRLKVYGDLNGVELENIHTMTLHDCSVDFMGNRGPGFTGRHDPANGILENWASLWVYDDACARLSSKQGYATENMDQLDLHLNNRIMTPVGAYFDEDLHGVALNGQLVKGEVIIGQNIYFEDSEAERVCVANWDANGDGGINIFEAEAVTSLGNAFTQNEVIENFNELKYFKGLTFIDEEAFGACTNLSQVTIPKNVTRLGRSCFAVSGLTRVVIPKSVRYFSGSDFQNCEQLSDVVFEEGSELQGLAWGSFLGCSSLEDIELPEGITVIPAYCFSDCGSLYWYSCDGPLTLIAESAFEGCSCLYVYIPDGVEYVGNSAFSGCYAESFSLPASVKYVGASAFPSCWDLYIPEDSQLEEVGDYAFSGCEYMSLTLPATLWKIGKHAFDRPDEGMGMFYDSEDPVTITVKRSKPAEVGESIFGQLPDGSEIYVPDGRANIYKSAWPEYEPYIVGGDAPTAIDAIRIGKVKDGVYTVNGQFIRRNATTEGLPSGIYVVNGKKVIVK